MQIHERTGHAIALHVGAKRRRVQTDARCWTYSWASLVGVVAPLPDPPRGDNEIAGVLAGAMGIGEILWSPTLGR